MPLRRRPPGGGQTDSMQGVWVQLDAHRLHAHKPRIIHGEHPDRLPARRDLKRVQLSLARKVPHRESAGLGDGTIRHKEATILDHEQVASAICTRLAVEERDGPCVAGKEGTSVWKGRLEVGHVHLRGRHGAPARHHSSADQRHLEVVQPTLCTITNALSLTPLRQLSPGSPHSLQR